ncbi:unnamed protein product [Blepharisma stoltei]|uniref:Uncharacterized protein n=1 Tax=Blepharisma stoltei TaxID=1481888 RepID=A0AAU9IP76_9CILI|nr:unnamed protein product [Blepharisma stoltei]
MLSLLILGVFSVVISKELIEEHFIKTEAGKYYKINSVSDKEKSYYESEKGCSLKCCDVCLQYSEGSALVQCTHQCGCDCLVSEIKETQLYSDLKIKVKLPRGEDSHWKIKVKKEDEHGNEKKLKFQGYGDHNETYEEHHAWLDIKEDDEYLDYDCYHEDEHHNYHQEGDHHKHHQEDAELHHEGKECKCQKCEEKRDDGHHRYIKGEINLHHEENGECHHEHDHEHALEIDKYKSYDPETNSSDTYIEWKTPSGEHDGYYESEAKPREGGWDKDFEIRFPRHNVTVNGSLSRDVEDTNCTNERDSEWDMQIVKHEENYTHILNVNGSDHIYREKSKDAGSLDTGFKVDWDFVHAVNIKPIKMTSCESRCDAFCQGVENKEKDCKEICYDKFCTDTADVHIEESKFGSALLVLISIIFLGIISSALYNKFTAARRKAKRITTPYEENLVGYVRL